jgi:hypothetical protein
VSTDFASADSRSALQRKDAKDRDMHDELFVDGVSEITVTGPTVRIDTYTLSPTQKDAEGNPVQVHRQRTIMTLEAFMATRDLFDRVAHELVAGGAVRRVDEPNTRAPSRPRGSPNFPEK